MPALLILAVISWLFGSGKSREKSDFPLFESLHLPRRRRWPSFVVSLALHSFCLLLVLSVSEFYGPDEDDYFPQRLTGGALVIKLPERIYLAHVAGETFPSAAGTSPKRNALRRVDLRRYTSASGNGSLSGKPTLLRSAQRKFELPQLPRRDPMAQTILQAELPANIPPPVEERLPQFMFWAAEARDLRPPVSQQAIQPGNRASIPQAPNLNASPTLGLPNREPVTSDLRMAAALSSPQPASLPRSPGTPMPIQSFLPASEPKQGPVSVDPFTGDPAHVLALSPDPAPLTDALKNLFIPAGNQLAGLPGAPPLFGFDGLSADQAGRNQDAEQAGSSFLDAAAAGDPAQLLHALPGDGRILGLLAPPLSSAMPVRMVHPSNGLFDVIVVQSSPSEAFPETPATLSGRPIYTVYLQVGAPKEWILQYCVPSVTGLLQTGNIVKLGNPAPVSAPYPRVTVRPPEDWQHGNDYLLVHGYLDGSGRFRGLSVIPGNDRMAQNTEAILEYLAYWEFRPAMQDGRPVVVEVILAVPPDQA